MTFLPFFLLNSEDEVEEAERLTTERTTGILQSTENPSTRDETPLQHFNPYLQYHLQEPRQEPSVKKSTESNFYETNDNLKDVTLLDNDENLRSSEKEHLDEPDESFLENDIDKTEAKLKYITQLENILAQRLHQNQTSDSKNTSNSKIFENPNKSNQYFSKSAKENGAKFLEHILKQRLHLHQNETSNSENTADSENFDNPNGFVQHLNESSKASGLKLLESILQHRLHLNESADPEKSKEFQEGEPQKDSQNLNSDNENGNGSEALAENANKDTDSKISGSNRLNHDNEVRSDDENKLKTLHQSQTETTEILDSPLLTNGAFHLPKNRDILKLDKDLVKLSLFTTKNSADTSEKPFQSNAQMDEIMESGLNAKLALATQRKSGSTNSQKKQEKNLADVDRFIQHELNKKKKVEDTSTTSLGLSGASHAQGKFALKADRVKDYANDNNFDFEGKDVGSTSGYVNNNNNDRVINNNTLNSNNTRSTYLKHRNSDNLNNNIIDTVFNDNDAVLFNNQENILDRNTTGSILDTEEKANKSIDKHLSLTPTTSLVNDTNKTKNNQNGNTDKYDKYDNNKDNNNLNSTYKTNTLNTTMKEPETISTITQNPNPSPQNTTSHYDLIRPEMASMKNKSKTKSKLKIESKKQNVSSDKKHGGNQSVDIQGKILPWEEFVPATKIVNEPSALFNNTGKITSSKAQSDSNESDDSINESYDRSAGNVTLDSGEVKVVDDNNVEPAEDEVVVETEKSGKQNDVNVIHSGDPDLEISP